MGRKYLAFDVEIAKEWPEGADWRRYRPLGITCAATLPADSDTPRLWHSVTGKNRPAGKMTRPDAGELVNHLLSAVAVGYTIVTWNGLGFDFQVLGEESGMLEQCRALAQDHVDMMFHVFCQRGHPVALDAAAQGMNLPGKPEGITGLLAPKMWADGKHQEVMDYVAQDARTTLDLATSCERQRRFRWRTRRGTTADFQLAEGWLTVRQAQNLPEPDTSWMSNPLHRRNFTAWLGS